jgi:hypothetical protein
MAGPITRSDINGLLVPILNDVFTDYHQFPELYRKVYSVHSSDRAVEYDMEMRSLGLASYKADGGPIASGSMGQAYQSSYVNQYYGISFEITRATVKDNQYKKDFPNHAKAMRSSLMTVKNMNAMMLFNNAFGAASTGSDGQPLCSTTHPYNGGVLSNTFSNGVQLSESALEDAVTIITSQWKNNAGLLTMYTPKAVLVPTARRFDIARILRSQGQPGSANNDINPLYADDVFKGGAICNPFITNPYSWFVLTDYDHGFKYFLREPLEIDFMSDNRTYNTVCSAIERYCFGYSSWRGVFGSTGLGS